MQRLETKPSSGRLLIFNSQGWIIHYRGEGRGDRLGPLAKQILMMLFHEPLTGAEIARRLGVWHNHVHISLRKLEGKGLLGSWTTLGKNLAGNQVLRRFYTLNPEKVAVAVPVRSPTRLQLQQAKEKVQREAIQREEEWIHQQQIGSPKPSTRLKAFIGRVR